MTAFQSIPCLLINSWTAAAINAVVLSDKILLGGLKGRIIPSFTNLMTLSDVASLVTIAIVHPVMYLTAISSLPFLVLDSVNGPAKLIENISNNRVKGTLSLVSYFGILRASLHPFQALM